MQYRPRLDQGTGLGHHVWVTTGRRRTLWVAAPLVGFCDVVSVVAQDRWWHPLSAVEIIVSLFITGPLVFTVLILAPAAILARSVSSTFWIAAAELLIAPVIVWALVAAATDEHSTAGLALLYIPVVGSAIAGAVVWWSRFVAKRNERAGASR